MNEIYSDDDTVNMFNTFQSTEQEQEVDVLFCDTNSISESTEMEMPSEPTQQGRKRRCNHDNSMEMERIKMQKMDRMCDLFERYLKYMIERE